ncbi:hypothetical protein EDD36DRAFT_75260 [Exophiala viscosa]|uniref:Uncharacterized protein n=1 Tax=Exophiala viscosa TaxID=2486360 RepID=A0AAN6I9X4_9EURO|nr:hypothetical protein EDD36DRAFT_75260 [Exophiala viscosa]
MQTIHIVVSDSHLDNDTVCPSSEDDLRQYLHPFHLGTIPDHPISYSRTITIQNDDTILDRPGPNLQHGQQNETVRSRTHHRPHPAPMLHHRPGRNVRQATARSSPHRHHRPRQETNLHEQDQDTQRDDQHGEWTSLCIHRLRDRRDVVRIHSGRVERGRSRCEEGVGCDHRGRSVRCAYPAPRAQDGCGLQTCGRSHGAAEVRGEMEGQEA